MASGAVILLGGTWLTLFLWLRDPGRIKATYIYNALTPAMAKAQVHKILEDNHIDELPRNVEGGAGCIEIRFWLLYSFDDHHCLSAKKLFHDSQTQCLAPPGWCTDFLQSIGLPFGRVIREWP